MILRIALLAAIGLGLVCGQASADPYIWIDISYKGIVNPATGQPAPYVTASTITNSFPALNSYMDRFGRGYRFRNAEPDTVLSIGGSSDPQDPSIWYNFDGGHEDTFRLYAYDLHHEMYAWNDSAINIFLATNTDSWCASCWGRLKEYILNGVEYGDGEGLGNQMIHEIGHYFGLGHTFMGTQCGPVDGVCQMPAAPGDDGIEDTAPDVAHGDGCCAGCENPDVCLRNMYDVAEFAYGLAWDQCSLEQRQWAYNTWYNIMSYHIRMGPEALFTEGQLDKWTDWCNSSRAHVVSGLTWFVDPSGSDANTGRAHDQPLPRVLAGVDSADAAGADIVLLRPGSYDEQITIDKPVTLRVTRAGAARIGGP